MRLLCIAALLWCVTAVHAQAPGEAAPSNVFPSSVTVKQLMLDLIHPSSNDLLLAINRGNQNNSDWAAARRAAVTLAESGNILMQRGRAREGDWMKDAKLLVEAGNAAYKAALARDAVALAAVGPAIDASCTACHKQYRPNVFPKTVTGDGGSK